MAPPRHDERRGRPGRDARRPQGERRPRGVSRGGAQPRARPLPAKPLPYRVARWGKFWSLEPLFADTRSYLVAKGGEPPKLDDLVLAVPVHGDRRRIVEVLGRADDLKAVLRAMIYARGLPQGFAADVLDEAAAVGARAARADRGRHDLTALPTFTIDPDTARDFDDAISVQREGAGYRAHVHIADVSYFVDDDGAIEREARRRTSSLYLPLFAEPMLPAALSSDLCSLVPRQPRKCLTVEFAFAADGRRSAVQFYRSLISSDHRLTYGFVDTIIGDAEEGGAPAPSAVPGPPRDVPDATTAADDELLARLRLAHELAGVLRRRRQARGALTLGSFEPEYAFDRAGALAGAVARPETPSHALVEEFMLAANEAVAEFLLRKKARTLYRVHEPPDPAKVRELLDALEELGVQTPPFPAGEAVPAAQLAEAFGRLQPHRRRDERPRGSRPAGLADAAAALAQAGALQPGQPRALRAREPGVPALHLADPPLPGPRDSSQPAVPPRRGRRRAGRSRARRRRRRLLHAASASSPAWSWTPTTSPSASCSSSVSRTRAGSRTFAGEIVGLVGGGLFVRFGAVFEGFLSSRRLGGERFEVSEHETALVGEATGRRYRLGDAVAVKVERIDRLRGKVDLAPALEGPERPLTGRNRTPAGARRARGRRAAARPAASSTAAAAKRRLARPAADPPTMR